MLNGTLDLNSEKVAPNGGLIAQGIVKVLGQPDMDLLAVLVREAVQNSWDARNNAAGGVTFGIEGWTLNSEQRRFLRKRIFAECPQDAVLPLRKHLDSDAEFQVLCLSDRGTIGLGGPTRADVLADHEQHFDFVDFLRNVGQPPEKALSGGTYGYGKAAFYRASRVQTICVYTKCRYKGKYESRFIAAALGLPYQTKVSRYTGRHWWGRQHGDIAEPILNADADNFAAGLGLKVFGREETGTSVLVLQPALTTALDVPGGAGAAGVSRTSKQAITYMVEQVLLYFWPKMLIFSGHRPPMQFFAAWEQVPVNVPDPALLPPLKGYVDAMRRLKLAGIQDPSILRGSVRDIRSQRPAQMLGRLALQQFMIEPFERLDTGEAGSALSNLTHHTALMRQPELVVKYLPGTPFPNAQWGCAGVFITDKEVDSVFALAEPPTHDDWVAKSLEESWHRRYVNVALREIDTVMSEFVAPPPVSAQSGELRSIVAFANDLGQSLLPAEEGPSAAAIPFAADGQEKDNNGSGSPSGKSYGGAAGIASVSQSVVGRAYVAVHGESLVLHENIPALSIRFSVVHAKNSKATRVRANVAAVIDGTYLEAEPPLGANKPKVLAWKSPAGTRSRGGDSVIVPASDKDNWEIIVTLPSDLMINVNLTAESS